MAKTSSKAAPAPADAPTTPAVPPSVSAQLVRLDLVDFSPTNPRKHTVPPEAELRELGHSIATTGLLNLLLLRPSPKKAGRLELVHGECRVRAARLVGITELPGRVVEMNDRAVLEAQLEENLRRRDLHPMEEAEGYRQLLDRHGYTADQLGERIGRSKAYVYARLKLCALEAEAAVAAFRANELDASHALLLARIPASLQGAAFRATKGMTYRSAAALVQRDYMLQLADAPFDTADAALVPAAGACGACPKRTGNQRELFADVRGADVCTDPACFKGKAQAAFALEAAKVEPAQVLGKAKAAKLFRGRELTYGSGFVDVDAPEALRAASGQWVEGKGAQSSLRTLLRKDLPTATLAPDEQGAPHWLVPKEVALKALRAAGYLKKPKAAKASGLRTASSEAAERRKREQHKARGEALVKAALDGILALPAQDRRSAVLEVLAEWALVEAPQDVAEAVASRRQGENKPKARGGVYRDRVRALHQVLEAAGAAQRDQVRLELALEIALRAGLTWAGARRLAEPHLALAVKLAGTSEAKVLAQVAKAAKAEKPTKGKGKAERKATA